VDSNPRRILVALCQEHDLDCFLTQDNATDAALAHSVGRVLDTQPCDQVADLFIRYAAQADLPLPEVARG